MRTVFGRAVRADGSVVKNGRVYFTVARSSGTGGNYSEDDVGTQVSPAPVFARTDSAGDFTKSLTVSADMVLGSYYEMRYDAIDADIESQWTVPEGVDPISVSELRTLHSDPGDPNYEGLADYVAELVDPLTAAIAGSKQHSTPLGTPPAAIADNTLGSGDRINYAATFTSMLLWCNTSRPPLGSSTTVRVKYLRGVTTTTIGSVSIAAGESSGSAVISYTSAQGDMLFYDWTALGSNDVGGDYRIALLVP